MYYYYLGKGYGNGAGSGDNFGRYDGSTYFFLNDAYLLIRDYTTAGSGIGTDNQYRNDVGGKPSVADRVIGGAQKVTGKVTDNPDQYQRGAERAVSWPFPSVLPFLNICFKHPG